MMRSCYNITVFNVNLAGISSLAFRSTIAEATRVPIPRAQTHLKTTTAPSSPTQAISVEHRRALSVQDLPTQKGPSLVCQVSAGCRSSPGRLEPDDDLIRGFWGGAGAWPGSRRWSRGCRRMRRVKIARGEGSMSSSLATPGSCCAKRVTFEKWMM